MTQTKCEVLVSILAVESTIANVFAGIIQSNHLVKVVGDWLVSPGHRTFERVHNRHMHDGPNVGEVALSDSEIERTEGLRGHNSSTIFQVSKPILEHVVHLEGEFL